MVLKVNSSFSKIPNSFNQTNDEIMRINDHPVWNLSKDEIDSLLMKSEGKVHVVLRR
jgi:uncharacterized protein YdcH (DUF465 family)